MTHAVEIECFELRSVDHVADRYLRRRLGEHVPTAGAPRAGDYTRAPEPQQNLLDIISRKSLLPSDLATVDGSQLSAFGEVQRAYDAVLCPGCDPHASRYGQHWFCSSGKLQMKTTS